MSNFLPLRLLQITGYLYPSKSLVTGRERRIYPGFLFQHVDCFDVFSPEDIFAEACPLDSYYSRENNLSWITVKQKLKFQSCNRHSKDRLDFLACVSL